MGNYIEKGKSFLSKKDYTKALEYFQAAIECADSPKDAHLGLAEAFFALDKSEKGKEHLFRAMVLDPNNPHGLKMIQKHFFSNPSTSFDVVGGSSATGGHDPVISICPHSEMGKNYYVAEQQSGNKIYFKVGNAGCSVVEPEEGCYWDGYDEPNGCLDIPNVFKINSKQYKVIAVDEPAFCFCDQIREVILPDDLQRIGNRAFQSVKISEIILPNNLREIGDSAFRETLIEKVICPKTLQLIGDWCFFECKNLTSVTLNEGIVEIGEHAFDKSRIKEVDIPQSVKRICFGAFPKRTIIRLHGNPPEIDFGYRYTARLYVPASKLNLYKNNEDWEDVNLHTF